ncbi:unnamed protein product [Gordionus sp. m RMFG-2023]
MTEHGEPIGFDIIPMVDDIFNDIIHPRHLTMVDFNFEEYPSLNIAFVCKDKRRSLPPFIKAASTSDLDFNPTKS